MHRRSHAITRFIANIHYETGAAQPFFLYILRKNVRSLCSFWCFFSLEISEKLKKKTANCILPLLIKIDIHISKQWEQRQRKNEESKKKTCIERT